jgi:endo-1,4-beta-xylanase
MITLRNAMLAAAALWLTACIPDLIADAGPDQAVNEGSSVTVKAGANVLDHIVNYKWVQTAGPKVNFKVSKKGVLTFTAPETEVQQKLTFELTVMYERGYRSKSDTVDITVNQIRFFGTAAGSAADYAVLLGWFDQLTPENAGKWGSVEATRDVMNWQPLDDAYNFARANHIPFKFHTLIWGQQAPGWITSLPPDQQLAEIDQWMAAVAARYPDIEYIDVVNEPINTANAFRDALGGAGTTGYDWVIKSHRHPRAVHRQLPGVDQAVAGSQAGRWHR